MKKKILSILLALVMVFSLIPTTMWAEEGNVAKIGDMEYATLADAIAAVPTDGAETTITMIADETISDVANVGLTVAAGKNIVLDLNGKTISGVSNLKSTHFIDNKGTLEITDSSANEDGKITFCAVADTGYSVENITIYNIGGKLTLTKGTIENATEGGLTYAVNTSSNAWGIGDDKYSEFTMTGGRLAGAKTDNTLRVYQNCAVGNVASHNTVSISGGVIDNGIFVDTFLYNGNANTANYVGANIDTRVDISGGTINGLIDLKIRHPFNTILNITGGDFTNAKLQVRKHNEYNAAFSEPTEPMVNISGGNFTFANTGKTFLPAYDSTTSSWTSYTDLYSITGGTYNAEPTAAYISEGYKAVDNGDGTWTVLPAVNYVAQIGNVKYATLADAIAAANASGNCTITILQDVDFSSEDLVGYKWAGSTFNPLRISATGVTLDLNGHGFYNMGNCAIEFGSIFSRDGTIASAAITNGTLEAGKTNGATNSYVLLLGGVDNVTISNITTNGGINACAGTNATISDCVVNGTKYYTVCAQTGSHVAINGTTFTKNTTAMDNTVATDVMFWVQGAGTDEDCITADNPTGAFGASSITLSGGTFTKGSATFISGVNPVITGGTFDFDPTAYVADGYEVTDNGDGTWTVSAVKVAEVNGVQYATLAEAIEAANDGDIVTLLSNVTLTGTQEIAKNLTIDGNNKTVTAPEGNADGKVYYVFYVVDEGGSAISVTLKDMTLNTTGYQVAVMANGDYNSTVNVNNVDITTDGAAIYANGHMTVQATDCDIVRSGMYTTGKDNAYYSALNVGYGGTLEATDCDITVNGGNGAASFPSGGTFTLTNVNITVAQDDESGLAAGYALWSRNEDYTNYPDYCMDSVINVTSGTINGDLFLTDKYPAGDAKNVHEPKISATGGTFDHDPTAYVADGYEAVDNNNGTWTVSAVKVAQIGNVKYATLEAAIAAANEMDSATVTLLRDYDMETNEPGYGWTTLSHSARENCLVISGNVTFDLGGHTLSNLFNNTFKITGNVTIQNGEMTVGQYTNGATCSYVMMTGAGANLVVNDLTTFGGINVSGATAEINNLSFSGTTFYAVCSQDNAAVTINNGTYTKAIPGSANYLFWVEAGSVMNITGGTFIKGTAKFNNGKVYPVITGGTFDFDPTNSGVAPGYEAVETVANTTWQVGEVKTTAVAAQETVAQNYEATYSASKKVVDENNETLASETPVTVNLKTVNNDVSTGNVLNKQYDVSTIVAAIVKAEGAKAPTLNVSISVVKDNPEVVVENNKKTVTYEVHPVATITNETGETLGTYTISNDQLAGGATFVIKLPVPMELRTSSGRVKVTHTLSDGSTVVYGSLAYDNEGFVTIADVAEFSEFELEIAETVTESASYGFTLALKNKIEIPLYVYNLSDVADHYSVEYSYTDADNNYISRTVCLTDNADYSVGSGWYRVVVAEFSAKQMSDKVHVRLYNNATGVDIYNDYYSIKQYCEYMIGGGTQTQSLIKLCKAALDYGKAAQLYFGYNLSSPIANSYYFLNSDVAIESKHASSLHSEHLFSFVGATVSLKSQVQVNFYFQANDYAGYTFEVNGDVVVPEERGGYYVVSVSGITAKDLGKPVTVTVTSYGEEETFSYSPLAYAYYIQGHSQNNELIDVCKAMYLYWSAANDYLN